MVTDAAGTVVKVMEYDSFGARSIDSNLSFDMPVGFAGGISDTKTSLVRFGYRDYEPGTGRWTAKDPIFFAGGQGNLYGYVHNDPVNFSDPIGLTDLFEYHDKLEYIAEKLHGLGKMIEKIDLVGKAVDAYYDYKELESLTNFYNKTQKQCDLAYARGDSQQFAKLHNRLSDLRAKRASVAARLGLGISGITKNTSVDPL